MSGSFPGLVSGSGLENGYVINGVANFYQAQNPTTRIDGSPLIVGDRNYRTDLSLDTFWNGTYWLTLAPYHLEWNNGNSNLVYTLTDGSVFGQAGNVNPTPFAPIYGNNNLLFVEEVYIRKYSSHTATLDAANKFDLFLNLVGTPTYIKTIDSPESLWGTPLPLATASMNVIGINQVVNMIENDGLTKNFIVQNVVGSPSISARLSWSFLVRGIIA